ncbi:MAG: hypothetical protein WBA41_04590 [Rivularia sp. (in: cyanobacteria)]
MIDLQDIKQRIASKDKETRLQALREALDCGQAGLKLVRANLNDTEIGEAVHSMIWEWRERRLRSKLKPGSANFISAAEDILYKPESMRFLVHDDGWEANNGFVPFIWEYDKLGEFKASGLFDLTAWDTEDFLNRGINEEILAWSRQSFYNVDEIYNLEKLYLKQPPQELAEEIRLLIDFLQTHLENFRIYRLTLTTADTEDYKPGEIDSIRGVTTYVRAAIFVGKIPQGDWIAITSKYRYSHNIRKVPDVNLQVEFKQRFCCDRQLDFVDNLENILQMMEHAGIFISENSQKENRFDTDYVWTVADRRDLAIDRLLKLARFIVYEEFDDFYYHSDEDYNRLAKFLRIRLLNVNYCTLFDTYLYILGNINQSDFAGVMTSFW